MRAVCAFNGTILKCQILQMEIKLALADTLETENSVEGFERGIDAHAIYTHLTVSSGKQVLQGFVLF